MKQSKVFHLLFPIIMMGAPWVYLVYIWNDLPAVIPTHFGIDGLPDQFGSKMKIIIAPIILGAVGILGYFILRNIHKIDPKRKYTETTSAIMSKLSVVIIMLLSFLSFFIFYSTLKNKITGMPIFFCGLSLFLAYIGNLMHSIKPNYFAGIRVPWTLENEDNWRKTHQMASKIWFAGGILLAILSLVLNNNLMLIVFISCILLMSIIPIIYSYMLYKKSPSN